jgi:hypothetical protein
MRAAESRRKASELFDNEQSHFSVAYGDYFWVSVVKKAVKEKGGFIDEN